MNSTTQAVRTRAANLLIDVFDGLALHQALFAAAELGLADLLTEGPR